MALGKGSVQSATLMRVTGEINIENRGEYMGRWAMMSLGNEYVCVCQNHSNWFHLYIVSCMLRMSLQNFHSQTLIISPTICSSDRVTHTFVSYIINGSYLGSLQTIIQTYAGILLVGSLKTNLSKILQSKDFHSRQYISKAICEILSILFQSPWTLVATRECTNVE